MSFRKINGHLASAYLSFGTMVLCVCGFAWWPVTGMAQAKDDRSQLRSLGRCEECSFEGLDLSGRRMACIDLSGSTFTNVDFTDAELNTAIFDNARLENVSFEAADLGGASFSGATLVNVSFDEADLTAAVFEGAVLEDTDLDADQLCVTQMPNEMTNTTECD